MSPIHPLYLERELTRCMRPNAHLFVRPDWRRFVRPGFEDDHPFALYERKYRPDQPRVPAGSREGGQWVEEGGDSRSGNGARGGETIEISAASRKASGHHYIPGAEIRNRGVSKEASDVFEREKTGKLYDPRSNLWDKDHRAYNAAVGEALDKYLAESGTQPGNMTADQAREFVRQIHDSTEPRIRNFNMIIRLREMMRRVFRGGGRE